MTDHSSKKSLVYFLEHHAQSQRYHSAAQNGSYLFCLACVWTWGTHFPQPFGGRGFSENGWCIADWGEALRSVGDHLSRSCEIPWIEGADGESTHDILGELELVVTGCHELWHFPKFLLGMSLLIPSDEVHHFSEGWPKTTNQITYWRMPWMILREFFHTLAFSPRFPPQLGSRGPKDGATDENARNEMEPGLPPGVSHEQPSDFHPSCRWMDLFPRPLTTTIGHWPKKNDH